MTPFVKNGLTLLGILIVGSLGYYLFVIQADGELAGSERATNSALLASEQFLRELNNIKEIDLDSSIFSDPRFQSLEDNSQPVLVGNIGRSNPFFQSP